MRETLELHWINLFSPPLNPFSVLEALTLMIHGNSEAVSLELRVLVHIFALHW